MVKSKDVTLYLPARREELGLGAIQAILNGEQEGKFNTVGGAVQNVLPEGHSFGDFLEAMQRQVPDRVYLKPVNPVFMGRKAKS
jgi:hypothetical protein